MTERPRFCLTTGLGAHHGPGPRDQVVEVCAAIHSSAGRLPALIAADQEGGQLQTMSGIATDFPGNMALAATGDVDLIRRVAATAKRVVVVVARNPLDLDYFDHRGIDRVLCTTGSQLLRSCRRGSVDRRDTGSGSSSGASIGPAARPGSRVASLPESDRGNVTQDN